jgi:CheY-like chemotaxis protein
LVLVVDDAEVNQRVAQSMLAKLGYRAHRADTGRQALEALERERYAAVLMDCQMPELDGFAATQELRRREGTDCHTPVIAMTAHARTGDQERCLAAGMDDYLSKPLDLSHLRAALHRWAGPPALEATQAPLGRQSRRRSAGREESAREPAGAAQDVLDAAALRTIRSLEAGVLPKLVEAYLASAPQQLAQLRAAADRDDAATLADVAHALKGSAAALGARRVAALSRGT